MRLLDFLNPGLAQIVGQAEVERSDLFNESELISVYSDVWRSKTALLFKHQSLSNPGNAILLVAEAVVEMTYRSIGKTDGARARNVDSMELTVGERSSIQLSFPWNDSLQLIAESFIVIFGEVSKHDLASPDYVDDREESIALGQANWLDEFVPRSVVFLR